MLVFVGILLTQPAFGSVIYDSNTGYATGIDGLSVSGTVYNVEFVADSYNGTFSTDPTFLNNEPGANAAADAIMAALNGEPSTPQIADGSSESIFVPRTLLADGIHFQAEQVGHATDASPWQRYSAFQGQLTVDYSNAPYSWLFARFSAPAAVPEPGALTLLVLGLMGIAVKGRLARV